MFLNKIVIVLSLIHILKAHGRVTDEEYAMMPEIFHLDNFDRCMLLGENALYCSVTIQLAPIDSNYSQVWKIIQEVSSNERNYRHDWLRHDICVPQSCPELVQNVSFYKENNQHLKTAISECYTNKYKNLGLDGLVTSMHCQTDKPFHSKDIYDTLVAICLAILIGIVIFGTYYEGRARYKTKEEYERITKSTFGQIISCFSLPKNWERLGSVNTNPDANTLKFINGMRVYTIFLVVLAHTCMVAFASPVVNPRYTETLTEDPLNMIFVNGNYAIQTFFLLAGCLLAYNFFLAFEGRKEVKLRYIWLAFINRYIRLAPCIIVMMAINGTWLYHLNRGPNWDKTVGEEYRNCRMNWWTNLLFINNYYDIKHLCLIQTWYLAADTQLFLVSLIILMFMWKYQKYIKHIFGVCLAVGILIPGIINYVNNYQILIREYPERLYNILLDEPEWNIMTIAAYTNITGYIIGLIYGYILYKYRNKKVFTKKSYVVIWWIITWTLPLGIIFLGVPLYEEGYESSRLGAAIYVAVAKTIFVTGICTATFGISQGIGWFLRDCIVWSPLQILGRLTYCVYLVHLSLIRVRKGQERSASYLSSYAFFIQAFGDLIIAYIFALILCLFVEMPTSALQKLIAPQLPKKRKEGLLEKSAEPVTKTSLVNGEEVSKV